MTYPKNAHPIQAEGVYHIYNRAIGHERLFTCEKDYLKFLENVKGLVLPHSSLFAYCLLPNHFHFLLQVKDDAAQFSKGMADACNSYARYFNTKYDRKGGLFMSPFKRKAIQDDAGFMWVAWYIHRNPLHHQITGAWQTWPWSSYRAYAEERKTLLDTQLLLGLYDGRESLVEHHQLHHKGWVESEME